METDNAYVRAFDLAQHNLELVCQELKTSPFCRSKVLVRSRVAKKVQKSK